VLWISTSTIRAELFVFDTLVREFVTSVLPDEAHAVAQIRSSAAVAAGLRLEHVIMVGSPRWMRRWRARSGGAALHLRRAPSELGIISGAGQPHGSVLFLPSTAGGRIIAAEAMAKHNCNAEFHACL
jgi:hypothetical protein